MRLWSAMMIVSGIAFAAPLSVAASSSDCATGDRVCIRSQLEQSAAAGDIVAKIELARVLLDEPEQGANWRRAANLLQQAAGTGDPWSTSILASLYLQGKGVPEDGRRVLALLIPLAADGSTAGLSGLGDLFAKGAGTIALDLPRAARYYSRAAAEGDIHGKYQLALMLLDGNGVPADVPKAITLLEDLSTTGDPWILIQLADVYASGKAEPAERALDYFSKAAATGSAPAMVRLGMLYRDGLGEIAPDRVMAFGYLERAVAADDTTGRIYLALMLLEDGASQDTRRAVQLLDDAAKSGSAWATTILADLLIKGDKIEADGQRALALLEPLAEVKNAAALASLGNLYAAGAGTVAADPAKARGYFEAAAALGDFGAKSRLGMMLVKAEGAKADAMRGLNLLRDVAATGDGWAKIQLGDVLASGGNVPIDGPGARAAYQAARDVGLPAGAIKLGYLYLSGKGAVAPDPARAAAYFAEAADSGESVGQISLALLLLEGKGVERDVDHAVRLLKLAATTGDAWANGTLGGLYADGRHMTPDYKQASQFSAVAQSAGDPVAMLRLGMLLATGPLAKEHRAEGVDLVEAAVAAKLPGAVVERARLNVMGLMGDEGGPAAESDLSAEIESGDPAALRLLLQLYRSGGAGLKASPRKAQVLLEAHANLLTPQAMAFETIALRAVPPATEQSLADIGAALDEVARTDFSQTVQMLFWGNKNAYVYALQYGLRDAGLYGGPLSGYLTWETIAAINRACTQQRVEQACAQGPLTPDVAALMGDYLANRPERLRS